MNNSKNKIVDKIQLHNKYYIIIKFSLNSCINTQLSKLLHCSQNALLMCH